MTRPTNLVSLDQRRRARRALQFFARLFGGGPLEDVAALAAPFPEIKHLPRLGIDIAVIRDAPPAGTRAALAYTRRRHYGLALVRLRDAAPLATEVTVDMLLYDKGIALLERLFLASPDPHAGRFWLVGTDVHLRVTPGGFVPTLTEPWECEEDRHSFISRAEQFFADFIWHD